MQRAVQIQPSVGVGAPGTHLQCIDFFRECITQRIPRCCTPCAIGDWWSFVRHLGSTRLGLDSPTGMGPSTARQKQRAEKT